MNRNGVNVEGAAHKQVVNLIKLSDDTLKYVIDSIENSIAKMNCNNKVLFIK